MEQVDISIWSLGIASLLVVIALLVSYRERLELEKEIVYAIFRAIVQLTLVGYVLKYIFDLDNFFLTLLLLVFMTFNAAMNARKRGEGIQGVFLISFIAIGTGSFLTLSVLLLSGALKFVPNQMVPVGGMIISNSMIAIGLSYRNMKTAMKDRREEVETKLSLGAGMFESARSIIKDSIRTGMAPTIDSAKTLGIVALPGMMSGLILAGVDPLNAIKYQIMVTFMLLSTTSTAALISCYLAYKSFFNARRQLK